MEERGAEMGGMGRTPPLSESARLYCLLKLPTGEWGLSRARGRALPPLPAAPQAQSYTSGAIGQAPSTIRTSITTGRGGLGPRAGRAGTDQCRHSLCTISEPALDAQGCGVCGSQNYISKCSATKYIYIYVYLAVASSIGVTLSGFMPEGTHDAK